MTSRRSFIDVLELPQIFVDAIRMCTRLGISCLRVATLCLVQDSKADVGKEIEIMGQVYAGAYTWYIYQFRRHRSRG
jgi:hypothetical protein